jgi:hypothetical protein
VPHGALCLSEELRVDRLGFVAGERPRTDRTIHRVGCLAATTLICLCLPASAPGAPSAKLHATLTPDRLGQGTTIGFDLRIAAPAGRMPPSLTQVGVSYPSNLGITTSGLGLATCSTHTLEALGPAGCPPDSRMGYGSALAEFPIGPEIVREAAQVTLLRGSTHDPHLALLVFVNAEAPIWAPLTLPALLLPAPAPFGGRIDIKVPLIPTFPGAPDVAVTQLRFTIGPQHLTYYERHHGRWEPYRPEGINLPDTCPRKGFPFAATLAFADGSHTAASTTVPCPAKTQSPQSADEGVVG